MTEQRCYFCGRNVSEYVEYVNNNCHIDIKVEVVDPDFEITLRVFTDYGYSYDDKQSEITIFREQLSNYNEKNWQRNPLDQRNRKNGWMYQDRDKRGLCIPDSLYRFNGVNRSPKITRSQFEALKKDVDAYKRKDMAALIESNDPVFFPMGYGDLGQYGSWTIEKYKSAKSCGYPFTPEMKKLLEKHFKTYHSSPNIIREFRYYQMEFEISIYEEAIKRIEEIFAKRYADMCSETDSRNRKEEEDKVNKFAEYKNKPFTLHTVDRDINLDVYFCPICEAFYKWASLS